MPERVKFDYEDPDWPLLHPVTTAVYERVWDRTLTFPGGYSVTYRLFESPELGWMVARSWGRTLIYARVGSRNEGRKLVDDILAGRVEDEGPDLQDY